MQVSYNAALTNPIVKYYDGYRHSINSSSLGEHAEGYLC